MWVARNKDGFLGLYSWCPERYNEEQWSKEYWIREMRLPRDMFPDLKWEDEPVEVFLITGEDYKLLQKKKEEDRREYLESLTPIEREIIKGRNKVELFKCVDRVKRYDYARYTEPTMFITINEFLEHDFYTDEGEYEAYLSDGEYFIGFDLHWLDNEECKEFIDRNKHLFGETKTLCIYFIDYPENK